MIRFIAIARSAIATRVALSVISTLNGGPAGLAVVSPRIGLPRSVDLRGVEGVGTSSMGVALSSGFGRSKLFHIRVSIRRLIGRRRAVFGRAITGLCVRSGGGSQGVVLSW